MKKLLPFLIGGLMVAAAYFFGYRMATRSPTVDLSEVLEQQKILLDSLTSMDSKVNDLKQHISTSIDDFEVQLQMRDSLLEERNKRFIRQSEKTDEMRKLLEKTDKSLDELIKIGRKMPF